MEINRETVHKYYEKLKKDAESGGYYLNPDVDFTKDLVESLMVNQNRYGYECCPCRLSAENKEEDLDIICPCDYRDADVLEFGACYCALYVSKDAVDGKVKIKSIPERRPPAEERKKKKAAAVKPLEGLAYPIWRCSVCGYLCARDNPPEICPVCKAKKERFTRFI